MFVAIYARVSSKTQDVAAQQADLERRADLLAAEGKQVRWFTDTWTGKSLNRPGWNAIHEAIRAGKCEGVVVWRLDRLGRTAAGLTALFEELTRLNVNLISIRDAIDLQTPSGRLMANVLASVAAFETEVRSERQAAGIAAAKAAGRRVGGGKAGRMNKKTEERMAVVKDLVENHVSINKIAKITQLNKRTVRAIIERLGLSVLATPPAATVESVN